MNFDKWCENVVFFVLLLAVTIVGGLILVFGTHVYLNIFFWLLELLEDRDIIDRYGFWVVPQRILVFCLYTATTVVLFTFIISAILGGIEIIKGVMDDSKNAARKRIEDRDSLAKHIRGMSGEFTAFSLAKKAECCPTIAGEYLVELCEDCQLEQITRGNDCRYRFPAKQTNNSGDSEGLLLDAVNQMGGVVSIIGLAIHIGESLAICQQFLEGMSASGYAELHVCNGHIRYSFPGIADKNDAVVDPLEDKGRERFEEDLLKECF